MNSRKQRRRTATTDKGADALDRRPQRSYHEAAHAVVARKLGQSCIGIMMFPTDRLFDGYHRTRAAKHIGRRTIAAHVISDETWVKK
jgi:hypothetical protein